MKSKYNPELYDLTHVGSLNGDIEWYCRLAKESGGPVLELGAGTGRIVIPVAREGIAIYALDQDQDMLNKLTLNLAGETPATRDLVTIAVNDMRHFRIEEKFSLIQIPFRAFLSNVTREDQRACLACCHEHLRPGGKLAFNIFHPSLDYMSKNRGYLEGVWRMQREAPQQDGGMLIMSETSRYDTVNQQLVSYLKWEQYNEYGNQVAAYMQKLELAYLYPGDIRELLKETGFISIQIDGDSEGNPCNSDSCELFIQAKKSS